MYQNHHIKQARCTCVGTHTKTCMHTHERMHTLTCKQTHTHTHKVPADQRTHITVFVPEWRLFRVTLVPKSLSKHTFMDTTIILTYPHAEEQLCRFVECWWAFRPQRVVSCISNNPEPENVSLFKKKFSLDIVAIVFSICSKWLSVEPYYGATRGKNLSFVFQYPGKQTVLGHENTSKYGNSLVI